ncbi:MAG: sigma-70 family RNA polymerase sigma factor [Ginsengibacter sp.]
MDTISDQYYIDLVNGGDTISFSVLVDRYKDFVFTLSLKMLQSREEAEEAAQDTFIKVFRSLKSFKKESKFSTWLYKISYNNCLDRIKKQKRNRPVLELNEFNEHEVISIMNVLETIEENERMKMIRDCLGLLQPEESFLITLYYFNENSLKEISEIMNINENNLKIKLFRVRKKLAGILKSNLEPELIDQYGKQGR